MEVWCAKGICMLIVWSELKFRVEGPCEGRNLEATACVAEVDWALSLCLTLYLGCNSFQGAYECHYGPWILLTRKLGILGWSWTHYCPMNIIKCCYLGVLTSLNTAFRSLVNTLLSVTCILASELFLHAWSGTVPLFIGIRSASA